MSTAGRALCLFQNGGRFGRAVDQIALLQTPPVSLIARTLQEHLGLSQQALLARGRSQWAGTRQSLAYHLRRLEAVGLVRIERRASHACSWPEPGLAHFAKMEATRLAPAEMLGRRSIATPRVRCRRPPGALPPG